jgi:hypothetical protein
MEIRLSPASSDKKLSRRRGDKRRTSREKTLLVLYRLTIVFGTLYLVIQSSPSGVDWTAILSILLR